MTACDGETSPTTAGKDEDHSDGKNGTDESEDISSLGHRATKNDNAQSPMLSKAKGTVGKPIATKASKTILKRSPRRSSAKEAETVQTDRSNMVMVVGLPALGIMLAYVTHRLNRKAPAYLGDFAEDIRGSLSGMASKLDIHAVKEMVDDENNIKHKRVPVPNRESLKVGWPVFIRICEDPAKAGDTDSRLKWGRNVAKAISFFAQKNFDYPSEFEFGMDLTPDESSTKDINGSGLADFLTFSDTLEVMTNNYYGEEIGKDTILGNQEAMQLFFGNKYAAATEYLSGAQQPEPSTLEDLDLEAM